jgi:hypothetical protein
MPLFCGEHTVFFSKRRKNSSLCAHRTAPYLCKIIGASLYNSGCLISSYLLSVWDSEKLFSTASIHSLEPHGSTPASWRACTLSFSLILHSSHSIRLFPEDIFPLHNLLLNWTATVDELKVFAKNIGIAHSFIVELTAIGDKSEFSY